MKYMNYRKHYPGNGSSAQNVDLLKTWNALENGKLTVKLVIKHLNMES